MLMLFCLLGATILRAQGNYHHVVAGSFETFEAASHLADGLKARNYDPVIMFPQGDSKLYRVSVYRTTNKAEAELYAKQEKAKGAKGYWVYSLGGPTPTPQTANARLSGKPTQGTTQGTTRGAASPASTTTYHLIMASLKDFESAGKTLADLQQKGFEPYLIMPSQPGGSYRVSVFTATRKAEIKKYSDLLKRQGRTPGWIWEEEPGTVTTRGIATSPARLTAGSATTYHLIGGSYKTFTQANTYASEMQAKGFSTLIMFPDQGGDGSFRVSIFRSTNKQEVEAFRQAQLKKNVKGWIFTQQ
ncbi:MAG: hypothetical protein OHK0039_23450 [Bacteroidia bacterium]